MSGGWGDGHGLADDIPVLPVVLCALGFGCGGTPKSAGEGVEWWQQNGPEPDAVTSDLNPGLTATSNEARRAANGR